MAAKRRSTYLNEFLRNSQIAELLALSAETAKMPLQKAFRRASRKAFLWQDEAADLIQAGEPLTQLPGIGPYLSKVIGRWIEDPPEDLPAPPPIRQHFLALPEARQILQAQQLYVRRLKGDLQMHTTWSDGSGSIEDMARAAAERGYEYIAITDHSKGLKIAGGISEEQLQQQADEIGYLNSMLVQEGHRIAVLSSLELNLNPQGQGDMDRRSLANLDLVLGCFHSALRKKDDQTERYLAALRNPDIQILGHPRGRIYNYRAGLSADWVRVFDAAAELDKAVEIDGYPDRQDLSLDLLRLAKKSGCKISLGTDSHDPSQMRFMDYSLAAAAMAGIKRDLILNFMSKDELLHWVKGIRGK